MKIIDILTAPWAIQPEKLLEMQAIYATHLRGEKIDIKAVEAALGHPLQNKAAGYEVIDGVAVIPVEGVMAKRMNLFTQISGGVSTELLSRDIKAAMNDASVHSLILALDSPGGSVDGTQLLANQIRSAQDKPIITHASGTMASAAYWIGSAASRVFIADATTQVGSIGVVATHTDVSGAEAQDGYKTTEITAGKYKRIASQYAPLTQEGRSAIQEAVDYYYSIFVADVAAQRRVSVEQVLADMADGRVFIGQQALDNGMVDGVATLDELIAQLNQERAGAASVSAAITQSIQHEEPIMPLTREQIEEEAAEIVAAIRADGAFDERARIKAVEEQLIAGHEALIEALKFDGKTTGPEAAVKVLAAERHARAAGLRDLRADTPPQIPHAPAPQFEHAIGEGLDIETRAKAAWDKDANLRAEFADDYQGYLAYRKAEYEGKVKVLKRSA